MAHEIFVHLVLVPFAIAGMMTVFAGRYRVVWATGLIVSALWVLFISPGLLT